MTASSVDAERPGELNLVHVGGMEPGRSASRGKIKHLDLTGTDDGHAKTAQSGVE